MFPTYLYGKVELGINGWSFGVEGSLNMAEVINPEPQSLDFNETIDILRGNAPQGGTSRMARSIQDSASRVPRRRRASSTLARNDTNGSSP